MVRRISVGKLYTHVLFHDEHVPVSFTDPTIELLTEADWVYTQSYSRASESDLLTKEEAYERLVEDGEWSEEKEEELKSLEKDLSYLQSQINDFQYQKSKQKTIKNVIKKYRRKIDDLYKQRDQLYRFTIEYVTELNKRRFIVQKISEVSDISLLSNQNFLDALVDSYYNENDLDVSTVREIARSDPWRLYWMAAKETGDKLFPNRVATEMTTLQYDLVLWSRIYDFAFENPERPPEEVINDDDKFDAWYEKETSKIEQENQKNRQDKSNKHKGRSKNGVGITESFIPADKDGAQEVYDLNNPAARRKVLSRQKALKTKGQVKEAEMPDMKQEIQMGLNRMAMQKGQQKDG